MKSSNSAVRFLFWDTPRIPPEIWTALKISTKILPPMTCSIQWSQLIWLLVDHGWPVALWKMMEFVSWDDDIANMWKNKKWSKPPTSYILYIYYIIYILYISVRHPQLLHTISLPIQVHTSTIHPSMPTCPPNLAQHLMFVGHQTCENGVSQWSAQGLRSTWCGDMMICSYGQ